MNRGLSHSSSEPRLVQKKQPKQRAKSLAKKPPPHPDWQKEPKKSTEKQPSVDKSTSHLSPELLEKFRNYDQRWFEETAKHRPEVFIDTSQYDQFARKNGYNTAFYGQSDSVIFVNDGFVLYTMHSNGRPTINHIYVGTITASYVTPNHNVLLLGVEEEDNAKVTGLVTDSLSEIFSLSVRHKVDCISASSGSEIFACLSILEDRVAISTFRVMDGQIDCVGNVIPQAINGKWELSFCPADDGVICALGPLSAYFIRCSGGTVETFSTIQFDNVLCHGWSSDVTICFGTKNGELRLFRETIPLETVDLKEVAKSVLEPKVSNEVTYISTSSNWFGVLLAEGLLLLFPIAQNGPTWTDCKAIVMTSYDPKSSPVLSFDQNEEFVLYSDGTLLTQSCIKYTDIVMKAEGLTIFGRHSESIVLTQTTDSCVFSMDSSGRFMVTSRITGRFLTHDKISDVLFFTVEDDHKLKTVRKNGIEKRILTTTGLVALEGSPMKNISMSCSSLDSKLIAVLQEKLLIIFDTTDNSIIVEDKMKLKREIRKMVFSTDSKFLIILGKNDQVFSTDLSTGKTIWNIEYKLKYFTDMCFANGIVYLLDNKFIVTRIRHGKEMSTLNMHAPEVGFTCMSKLLTGDDKKLICATDSGEIIVLELATPDQPFVLNQGNVGCASCLSLRNDVLTIGYENGSVSLVDFSDTNSNVATGSSDWILCDDVTYKNLSEIITELDFERNRIREETEQLMKEYKEAKEKELARISSEYETSKAQLIEKVQKLEESYKQSEDDKKRTVKHLQELYKEESAATEDKYERMVNEQIRKTLKIEEQHQNNDRLHQQELEDLTLRLKESFHKTEIGMKREEERLHFEIDKLNHSLQDMKRTLVAAENEQERSAVEFKRQIEEFHIRRREDTTLLENEIWSLKATSVQLGEDRDRYANEASMERQNLQTAKQQIANLKGTAEQLQATIEQQKAKFLERDRHDIDEQRKYNKLHQKLVFTEREMCEIQRKSHKATRRCGELEARIQRVADCVYDSRRLEHAVLGLIAFMQNIDADEQFKLS